MNRLRLVSTPLLCAAALALTATVAGAVGGINLSWNDCGTFGAAQKNFACNTNTGTNTMYASAIAPVAMPLVNGCEGVIDLQTDQLVLSNWWQMAAGGCRASGALSASFSTFAGPFSCADLWGTGAFGAVNYTPAFGGPNKARIRVIGTVLSGTKNWSSGLETYMFSVSITNAKSTGTGACAGCTDGACIVFNSLLVTQSAGGNQNITTPITSSNVTWQAGGNVGGGCPGATPTRASTWGSVKSLYR